MAAAKENLFTAQRIQRIHRVLLWKPIIDSQKIFKLPRGKHEIMVTKSQVPAGKCELCK